MKSRRVFFDSRCPRKRLIVESEALQVCGAIFFFVSIGVCIGLSVREARLWDLRSERNYWRSEARTNADNAAYWKAMHDDVATASQKLFMGDGQGKDANQTQVLRSRRFEN